MLEIEELLRSPAWLPLRAQGGRGGLTMLKLDENAYQAASFLDERLLEGPFERTACAVATVEAAAAGVAPRSHYIFHIGHVGSTLISRLVGEHERFFSLREPALLRAVADDAGSPGSRRAPLSLGVLQALFARTWRAAQTSIIKPTSIVNECAETILAGADLPRAIFVFADPLAYLRGIMAGPNSRLESQAMAPGRCRRLLRRLRLDESQVDPASEGERIAMNWLSEMTTLQQAARGAAARVLWVAFDVFLQEPMAGLAAIFRALGAPASDAEVGRLVTGPLMRRYSKAPQLAYDAALRRDVLRAAQHDHGGEIKRGIRWLGRMGARHPLVRTILDQRGCP